MIENNKLDFILHHNVIDSFLTRLYQYSNERKNDNLFTRQRYMGGGVDNDNFITMEDRIGYNVFDDIKYGIGHYNGMVINFIR